MDSFSLLYLLLVSTFLITINSENPTAWYSQSEPSLKMVEKVTHLHFYYHDQRSGENPTSIQIAGPDRFGSLVVEEDPLTVGPEATSKVIGKAQGIYVGVDKHEAVLVMIASYAFMEGIFNGSTLSIITRNPISHPVREVAIVGGTGLFRRASGYAILTTVWYNVELKDAVVEYNMTVFHY